MLHKHISVNCTGRNFLTGSPEIIYNYDIVSGIWASAADKQKKKSFLDLLNTDWGKLLKVEKLNIDDREPLRLEQEAFIHAIAEGQRPQVSAEDAVAAMELAERIVEKIGCHAWEGNSAAVMSARHWQNEE